MPISDPASLNGPDAKKAVICAPDTPAGETEKTHVNFVYALAEAE